MKPEFFKAYSRTMDKAIHSGCPNCGFDEHTQFIRQVRAKGYALLALDIMYKCRCCEYEWYDRECIYDEEDSVWKTAIGSAWRRIEEE